MTPTENCNPQHCALYQSQSVLSSSTCFHLPVPVLQTDFSFQLICDNALFCQTLPSLMFVCCFYWNWLKFVFCYLHFSFILWQCFCALPDPSLFFWPCSSSCFRFFCPTVLNKTSTWIMSVCTLIPQQSFCGSPLKKCIYHQDFPYQRRFQGNIIY